MARLAEVVPQPCFLTEIWPTCPLSIISLPHKIIHSIGRHFDGSKVTILWCTKHNVDTLKLGHLVYSGHCVLLIISTTSNYHTLGRFVFFF